MNQVHLNAVQISNTFKNTFIVFCLCFMFLGCSPSMPSNTSFEGSQPIRGNLDSGNNPQDSQENQRLNSCDSSIRSGFIFNDDIQIPQAQGQYVENCHDNPNYNACIYHHDPFTQNGSLIPEFENIFSETVFSLTRFNEAMRSHQNYGVNITGTINWFLKNEHYNIKNSIRLHQQSNGKWTIPYVGADEISPTRHPQQRHSVEQVMAYYYLMYQKEWMELNAGQWYASGKRISVDFSDASSYWHKNSKKINLRSYENLFNDSLQIPASMHAGIILHEAGHANFDYSNRSREGSESNAYRECKFKSTTHTDKCCSSADGCFEAISEGQSDLYILMMFPNFPLELSLEKYIHTLIENPRSYKSHFR